MKWKDMNENLVFYKVERSDTQAIDSIYHILEECGEDMLNNQGLTHWGTPLPHGAIAEACKTRDVYLVTDVNGSPLATFQLENLEASVALSKFAVLPSVSRHGIGSFCLNKVEELSKARNKQFITLDVYEKSSRAVTFYLKNGFIETGKAHTRCFVVLLMEKRVV